MGVMHVTALIPNPTEPDRTWEGLFLVDTGAGDCLVPRQHLEAIGLIPEGQRIYGRADGSEDRMDVTVGRVEFMGDIVGATIVFGEAGAEPLLGRHGVGVGRHRGRSAQPDPAKAAVDAPQKIPREGSGIVGCLRSNGLTLVANTRIHSVEWSLWTSIRFLLVL